MDGINRHYYVWGLGFQGDSTTYTMVKVSQDQFDRLKKLNAEITEIEKARDRELKDAEKEREPFFGDKSRKEIKIKGINGKYEPRLNPLYTKRTDILLENKLDAPGTMLNFKGRNGAFGIGEAVTRIRMMDLGLRLILDEAGKAPRAKAPLVH